MTTLWQTRLGGYLNRAGAGAAATFSFLARPAVFLNLQRLLMLLIILWIVLSVWRATWSFLPEAPALPAVDVLNPVSRIDVAQTRAPVDIDALVAAQLFGEPGAAPGDGGPGAEGQAPAMTESEAAVALAGIENGAPETRLPLLLRGVLAASEAGLGQAVIEHRKLQDLYQVGDALPVNGNVELAKVLPDMVVLDNGGSYETLRLFEEGELDRSLRASKVVAVARSESTPADVVAVPATGAAPTLAAQYRDRLYRDPQSLTDVVRVSAVREDGQLRGYRLSPGSALEAFTTLGFEAGDLVTAVNGLSLSDPANTMRLYQAMRSADSASFEIQRKGESVTLNVSIGQTGSGSDR